MGVFIVKSMAILKAPDISIPLLVSIGGIFYLVFGKNNVGFLVLTLIFMLIEMLLKLAIATLDDADDFEFKDFVQFWIKRGVLLVIPLVGSAVDHAYHWAANPGTILHEDVYFYATKSILIALLAYQLREVTKLILTVHKDFWLAKRMMFLLDRLTNVDRIPPPEERKRSYDLPKDGKEDQDDTP